MAASRAVRAAALISLFLAGCKYNVNTGSARLQFDRAQNNYEACQKDYDEKAEFVKAALAATSTKKAQPYPQMESEIKTMSAQLAVMKKVLPKVETFKTRRYDAWAADKPSISSEDKEGMNQLHNLGQEYNGIVAPLDQAASVFRQSSSRISQSVAQYKITKTDLETVHDEVKVFNGECKASTDSMENQLNADTKAIGFAALAGLTGVGTTNVRHKAEILTKMSAMLPATKLMQKTVEISATQFAKNVPAKGEAWTGPGMKGSMDLLLQFREMQTQFKKQEAEFQNLAQQFDAEVPAQAPAQ